MALDNVSLAIELAGVKIVKDSFERIKRVLEHQKPDRAPIFDLICNDQVLQHFNNGTQVGLNDDNAGIKAFTRATDGTRWNYFSPMPETTEQLKNSCIKKTERWTVWISDRKFASSKEYLRIKTKELDEKINEAEVDLGFYLRQRKTRNIFGNDYYFVLYGPSVGLMHAHDEVGLEAFSYYMFDCEDVILKQMDYETDFSCRWAKALPKDDPFDAIFIGEDIAYKTGLMVNPKWLKEHFFPRLKRVVDAYHDIAKKVIFHSDGNLNSVMDDLVETGIDALNPIEIAAGMNLADLHKRYPKLVFCGGIDVVNILNNGSTQRIKDTVVKSIEDTEGQILVGSSTEITDDIPLKNFLAMREAAIDYKY